MGLLRFIRDLRAERPHIIATIGSIDAAFHGELVQPDYVSMRPSIGNPGVQTLTRIQVNDATQYTLTLADGKTLEGLTYAPSAPIKEGTQIDLGPVRAWSLEGRVYISRGTPENGRLTYGFLAHK